VKLNLCCGRKRIVGFEGIDREKFPDADTVDRVVDLNKVPWPWNDDSVDEVFVQDGLEHLFPLGITAGQRNIVVVLAEIHRILKPGGVAEIIVPSTDGPGAFQDPTHVTYWNRNTFLYFISGYMGKAYRGDYPEFALDGNEFSISDTIADDVGVIWTVAKMRKPEVDTGG
jgi:SAM-dependent methyltransferase